MKPTDNGKALPECTCGRIVIGTTVTENRNWNPDCPEHGEKTTWFEGEGGDYLRAQVEKAIVLQRQAREARKKARGET